MANGSLAAPIIAGLAAGIAFVIIFALMFSAVIPIIGPIYMQEIVLFPQILLIDESGSQYAGNITTFRWGRGDSLFIGNISDTFGHTEETTIALENGSVINFIAGDYHDGNAIHMTYQLPMSVYVYRYPSNDFESMLQEIDDGSGNRTSFIVDKLAEGDYYLRVNHQNQEKGGGSVSYYFKVRIT